MGFQIFKARPQAKTKMEAVAKECKALISLPKGDSVEDNVRILFANSIFQQRK
jgi:hypothetical protein